MRFFHTYPRDVGGTKVHATATTAALFQCPPHLLHLQRRYIGSPSARCARALHSCFGLVKWRVRSRALSFARERRRVFERCASLRVKNQRLLLLPTYLPRGSSVLAHSSCPSLLCVLSLLLLLCLQVLRNRRNVHKLREFGDFAQSCFVHRADRYKFVFRKE